MLNFRFLVLPLLSALYLFSSFTMQAMASEPKKPYFVLLRPDDNHPFWALFETAMKAACADLICDLEVKFAGWDHFKMIEQAKELGKQDRVPDMVFFQSFKNNGSDIIKALEESSVNAFLVNAGLTPEQSAEMGKPREKYKHWVAQMMPDDFGAGVSTAEALYKTAKEKSYANKDGKIIFAAIEGNTVDGASIERLKGLRSVVEKHPDFELLQVVQGKWDTKTSHDLTLSLLRRYPDLHVIWAAGDPIAFGILDATREIKLADGTILTAGVDWAERALNEVKSGAMVGTAGGHFMEGAWATVLAYDYVMGKDFSASNGTEIKSVMGFLDKNNVNAYTEKFGAGNFDSVDFKTLSKVHTPELQSYIFDMAELLK